MPIHLTNTLTGRKEEFSPLRPPQVTMYVCGVTVYDDCHIGHARGAVVFDVLRRFLESDRCKFQVKYVRNITDVDDKIINRARHWGQTPEGLTPPGLDLNAWVQQIAQHYTGRFQADFARLVATMKQEADQGRNTSLLASLEFSRRYLSSAARAALPWLGLFSGGVFERILLDVSQIEPAAWEAIHAELQGIAVLRAENDVQIGDRPFLRFHPTPSPRPMRRSRENRRPASASCTFISLSCRSWTRHCAAPNPAPRWKSSTARR